MLKLKTYLPFRMVSLWWLVHLVFFDGAVLFNVNELKGLVIHYCVCLELIIVDELSVP